MHKKPAELSQGMRQRVGLARAFALDPKVLLLDEPFGMLDSLTRFELQEVLVETWAADRKTALMVTHDVDEALFLSDRIALMTNGPAARLGGILDVPFPRPRTARRGPRAPRVLRPPRKADRLPRGTRRLQGRLSDSSRPQSTEPPHPFALAPRQRGEGKGEGKGFQFGSSRP